MRADNHGEGGVLALTALISPTSRSARQRRRWILVALGLFGTALLYGDGMITPAISVLAAVEGLSVAAGGLESAVVPIAALILVGLFSIQRKGTTRVGIFFGPVMLVWTSVLSALGIGQIAREPGVIAALWPGHAIDLITTRPGATFVGLGGIFLVVTGSEALYADMGHFGRRPIRLGWFFLVLPALTINYLGQAALLARDPGAVENPFYLMAPSWALWPLVVLATMATVIASQALITGAYSLTAQAIQLGYLPRLHIDHTSPREIGQVYVPVVNWLLMGACVGLVFFFGSSTNLAAAYGIAVTTTMLITTLLLFGVMRHRWKWNRLAAGALAATFFLVELVFFSSNVLKIAAGGWFPLVVGGLIFGVMAIWHYGRERVDDALEGSHLPLERFIQSIHEHPQNRVPGTGVFLYRHRGFTPPVLLASLRATEVLPETVVIVNVDIADAPQVPPARRATVHTLGDEFHQVTLHFGFIEPIDVPAALSNIVNPDFGFDLTDATFFVGKETVLSDSGGLAGIRGRIFSWLHRNASDAARYFNLPPSQVIEVGVQLEIE